MGKTIVQITPWLFGGYCQLEGELSKSDNPCSFNNLPYKKKFYIGIAGCAINIITGLIAYYLGIYKLNYNLYYFGWLSLWLGITNLFPFIPCLDGGYLFYLPILFKKYGQEKGTEIFCKWVTISFKIIMILNILSIPILIFMLWAN